MKFVQGQVMSMTGESTATYASFTASCAAVVVPSPSVPSSYHRNVSGFVAGSSEVGVRLLNIDPKLLNIGPNIHNPLVLVIPLLRVH
jgi:hypothetical protein